MINKQTPFTSVKEKVEDITFHCPNTPLIDAEVDVVLEKYLDNVRSEAGLDENGNPKEMTDEGQRRVRKLSNKLTEALSISYPDGEFIDVINSNESEQVQAVIGVDGEEIRIGYPELSSSGNDDSVLRWVSSGLGIGSTTRIPLWSSGVVLVIDSFKEIEMQQLSQRMAREQGELGIKTRGIVFSGEDVLFTEILVDFVLDHVVSCNIKKWSVKTLKSIINTGSYMPLLAGALAAIYPSGYPVGHYCNNINGTKDCNHLLLPDKEKIEETGEVDPDDMLHFPQMVYTDISKIDDDMINFMSQAEESDTHDIQEVIAYQKHSISLLVKEPLKVIVDNSKVRVEVEFALPSFNKHVKTGKKWIEVVTNVVDDILSIDDMDGDELVEERRRLINSFSVTLGAVKDQGWVSKIIHTNLDTNEKKVIESPTLLSKVLEKYSSLTSFRTSFDKELQIFKEQIFISLTGLPNYRCPSCGKGQVDTESKNTTLIPIDMMSFFYSITELRQVKRLQNWR